MKIANIVSNNKIDVSEEFNVVQSMDEIIHGLPTLIVGYDYVNKHYPDFDIMEIRIEPNLYWTFKRTEKRDKFHEDLSWFIRKVYGDLTKEIIYIFVDPLQYRSRTLWKIIRKIYSLKKIITYVHGDMVYLYGEKYLFGVDLKLLSYIGLNSDKILNKIKSMSVVFLGADDILIEYKNTVEELGNKVRYIPYLFSIKNEQNDTTSIIHIPRES
jgi:archaellum component FlaC